MGSAMWNPLVKADLPTVHAEDLLEQRRGPALHAEPGPTPQGTSRPWERGGPSLTEGQCGLPWALVRPFRPERSCGITPYGFAGRPPLFSRPLFPAGELAMRHLSATWSRADGGTGVTILPVTPSSDLVE